MVAARLAVGCDESLLRFADRIADMIRSDARSSTEEEATCSHLRSHGPGTKIEGGSGAVVRDRGQKMADVAALGGNGLAMIRAGRSGNHGFRDSRGERNLVHEYVSMFAADTACSMTDGARVIGPSAIYVDRQLPT